MSARSIAILVCAAGCLTVYALVNFLPRCAAARAWMLAVELFEEAASATRHALHTRLEHLQ